MGVFGKVRVTGGTTKNVMEAVAGLIEDNLNRAKNVHVDNIVALDE